MYGIIYICDVYTITYSAGYGIQFRERTNKDE